MSFEMLNFQKQFQKQKEETKNQNPYEILNQLRQLQNNYLEKNTTEERKKLIEDKQNKLCEQLKNTTDSILDKISKPDLTREKRNSLIGKYGFLVDQLAINLPLKELMQGRGSEIQGQAIKTLEKLLKDNIQSKEIYHSLFMLFHHGAGVDSDFMKKAYEQFKRDGTISVSKELASQYLESEKKAKNFLKKYLSMKNNKKQLSLNQYYNKVINSGDISKDQLPDILDVANWYRRMAYFQKISGAERKRQINTRKAIRLYKIINNKQSLQRIYKEQELK